jgi:uncharacterized membrane protein YagU involved in acid resistance
MAGRSFRFSLSSLVRAGLLTGVIDGLFSSILSVAAYGSTVTRLFQGVASVPIGRAAFERGTFTAALGLLIHFCVAFAWSAVFLFLMRSAWVRRILESRHGVLKVAALYGPSIWMVMSLVLIPLVARRPPTINVRWWIQFVGHFPFVGLPIVWAISQDSAKRTPRSSGRRPEASAVAPPG